jgi:hypothetical protein
MSRLLENSDEFRQRNKSRNTYTENDNYVVGHPNAKSDGDEKGKGLNQGQVGSLTDIAKRNQLETKNTFNRNNPYNINNA